MLNKLSIFYNVYIEFLKNYLNVKHLQQKFFRFLKIDDLVLFCDWDDYNYIMYWLGKFSQNLNKLTFFHSVMHWVFYICGMRLSMRYTWAKAQRKVRKNKENKRQREAREKKK